MDSSSFSILPSLTFRGPFAEEPRALAEARALQQQFPTAAPKGWSPERRRAITRPGAAETEE
jgi:hypothetical protein